ncbi:unnamed protein product, partial [Tilletia caries]
MRYDTTQASRSRSSTEIRKLHSHIATPLSSSHSSAESRRSRARPETLLSSSDEEEAFQHVGFEYGSEVGSNRSGFTSQMEPRRPFGYFRPKVDALSEACKNSVSFPLPSTSASCAFPVVPHTACFASVSTLTHHEFYTSPADPTTISGLLRTSSVGFANT